MTAIDDRTDLWVHALQVAVVCDVCHCAHEGCDAVVCRGLDLD